MQKSKILTLGTMGAILLFLAVAVSSGVNIGNDANYLDKVSPIILQKFAEGEERVEVIVGFEGNNGVYRDDKVFEKLSSGIEKENILYVFKTNSFIARLNEEEVLKLSKNRYVTGVDYDEEAELLLPDSIVITKAEDTWDLQSQGQNLDATDSSVCIIDTGVDFTHPDLVNKNIVGANVNCPFVSPCSIDPNLVLTHPHGTAMAGDAGAYGGVTGIGRGVNIVSIYAQSDTCGNCISFAKAMQGIEWCADHADEYNISMISMSFGGGLHSNDTTCMEGLGDNVWASINYALTSGITSVAGAGNDDSNQGVAMPACLDNVIAIGGTTKQDYRWSDPDGYGSNYFAPLMKVFAPAKDIYTTYSLDGGYDIGRGTSHSTPMVASAIAMMKQYLRLNDQDLNDPVQLEQILFDNGEQIIDLDINDFRRINIYNALLSLDEFNPVVQINAEEYYNTNQINLDYSIEDELSLPLVNCWYVFNSGSQTNLDCNGNSLLITGNEGQNTLEIFGEDHAGNIGSEAVSFEVDTVSPVVSIVGANNGFFRLRSRGLTVNYDITDAVPSSGFSQCWYTVNGGSQTNLDCNGNSFTFKTSQQNNLVEVFAIDNAGNVGNDSLGL